MDTASWNILKLSLGLLAFGGIWKIYILNSLNCKGSSQTMIRDLLNTKDFWIKLNLSCVILFGVVLFQTERSLSFFLYEKLKEAVTSLLQSVAQSLVLESSIRKPIKQDFSLDTNLLPAQLLVWVLMLSMLLKATEIWMISFGCNWD